MGRCRPSIRYSSIFWGTPNAHLQQNLKVMILSGVTMLVLGSSGWLLSSNLVEIICQDQSVAMHRIVPEKNGYQWIPESYFFWRWIKNNWYLFCSSSLFSRRPKEHLRLQQVIEKIIGKEKKWEVIEKTMGRIKEQEVIVNTIGNRGLQLEVINWWV